MEPRFLGLADVVKILTDQVALYGGEAGIRDLGLLGSAIDMPQASFRGEWLHRDLFEMAAAYAFHPCQNHPFIDGNKRTGLATALVFLEFNGVSLRDPTGRLYSAMMSVASGDLDKLGLAAVFRSMSKD